MLKYTTIAGKEYPISFGTASRVSFESETGIPITEIGTGTAYSHSLRLLFSGLRDGARQAKTNFNLDFYDFCDLLDEDPEAIPRLEAIFHESLPEPPNSEKKAKPARKG